MKELLNGLCFAGFLSLMFLQSGCDGQNAKEVSSDQPEPQMAETINVYAHRPFPKGLLDKFEKNMETKVAILTGHPDSLIAELEKEGAVKSADLAIFGDLGDIFELKNKGMLQPFSTEFLEENIASRNMDYEGTWIGLSKWAMAFAFNPTQVNEGQLVQYADFAKPEWKGKLLITKAKNRSNQTLVASMLATEGEKVTRQWLSGVMANLAEAPVESSKEMIKALSEGRGQLGLMNATIKVGWQFSGDPEFFKMAEALTIKYPVNPDGATYYNLTAAGLFLNTTKRTRAIQAVEFLTSKSVQETFSNAVHEYPVNLFALPNEFLIEVGGFSEKRLDFSAIAQQMDNARSLMEEAGW